GQREDREARLLLRGGGRLFEPSDRLGLGLGRAGLEHGRVRGYCEEVLGQSVVNLARDARAFLRDGAPELGEPDGAPGGYEQDAEGEDTQEVRLRDRSAPQQGREE